MKKKILSMVLALCMVLAVLPRAAFAVAETGTAYVDGIGYHYEELTAATVEITGYDGNTEPTGHLTIPAALGGKNVTKIGDYAFSECAGLETVTFQPGSQLKTIDIAAFYQCGALTEITIPDSVTTIGAGAFELCEKLDVTVPAGVTAIGGGAFNLVKSVDLSANTNYKPEAGLILTKDGKTVVSCVARAAKVTIPAGVETIEGYALEACEMTGVELPAGLKKIGDHAFYHCYDLTEITIPEGVTKIGAYAFSESALKNITIPKSVTEIGAYAFYYCYDLTEATISGDALKIGDYAFYYCYDLTKATICEGVTKIGERSFYCCYALTDVVISKSVTEIGGWAFDECRDLTEITIPAGVEAIGASAFYECKNLETVTVLSKTAAIGEHAFARSDGSGGYVINPAVKTVNYAGTEAEWNAAKGDRTNADLGIPDTCTIHYNYPLPVYKITEGGDATW